MKRIILTVLGVLLIATMAIGGSVAYLTGEDDDVNTFIVGDVSIDQIEQKREKNENGYFKMDTENKLVMTEFVNDAYLLPSSSFSKENETHATESVSTTAGDFMLWKANNGEIDKIVTVKNTGNTAAYVRTIFAFEDTGSVESNGLILKNCGKEGMKWEKIGEAPVEITREGKKEMYNLYTCTYTSKLEPGMTSAPSLLQVAMAGEADNETSQAIFKNGDQKYTILVATQAVQADNMKKTNKDGVVVDMTAEEALNVAFEAISADNNPWTEKIPSNAIRTTSATELNAALNSSATDDAPQLIYLMNDYEAEVADISKDTIINLHGNTLTAIGSEFKLKNNANLTIKNGKYVASATSAYVDVRPTTAAESKIVFDGVEFVNDNWKKVVVKSENHLGYVVKLNSSVQDTYTEFEFKNCTFKDAKIGFDGYSRVGKYKATFEDCTFTAQTSKALIDTISTYLRDSTITFKNCTFNIEATSQRDGACVVGVPTFYDYVKIILEGSNTMNVKPAVGGEGETITATVETLQQTGKTALFKGYANTVVTGKENLTINITAN